MFTYLQDYRISKRDVYIYDLFLYREASTKTKAEPDSMAPISRIATSLEMHKVSDSNEPPEFILKTRGTIASRLTVVSRPARHAEEAGIEIPNMNVQLGQVKGQSLIPPVLLASDAASSNPDRESV